jgi:DNA mismatch endonuclease, patch repair protein
VEPRPPSYKGLRPASQKATAAARGASRKADTLPEVTLRRLLFAAGRRFRKNVRSLPGCPDIVFGKERVAIFCDGDFWHGRDWKDRRAKLASGSNPAYWITKIERNIARDLKQTATLEQRGWRVLRFWESEIRRSPEVVLEDVLSALNETIDVGDGMDM